MWSMPGLLRFKKRKRLTSKKISINKVRSCMQSYAAVENNIGFLQGMLCASRDSTGGSEIK